MSESPKSPKGGKRELEERRKFLRAAAAGATVVGCSLAGFLPVRADGNQRLRPPGALDEEDFLAACIKCGQCVQVCPVKALHPADLWDGFGVGVPFIDPRKQACDFACDVGQCILACPTGALEYRKAPHFKVRKGAELPAPPVLVAKREDPDPTLQVKERMGVARLAREEACLAVQGRGIQGNARGGFHGLKRYVDVDRWRPVHVDEHPYQLERCDLCVRECPIQGAIRMETVTMPDGSTRTRPSVQEACVGCGTCQMMCPAEPAAIVVEPRGTWGGA